MKSKRTIKGTKKKRQSSIVELICQLNTDNLTLEYYSDTELADLFGKVYTVENTISNALGFSKLNCDKILGSKNADGKQWFLVSWVDNEKASFVPAPVLHRLAPDKVIEFYESRLKFRKNGEIGELEEIEIEPLGSLIMKKQNVSTAEKVVESAEFSDNTASSIMHQQQMKNISKNQSKIEAEMLALETRKQNSMINQQSTSVETKKEIETMPNRQYISPQPERRPEARSYSNIHTQPKPNIGANTNMHVVNPSLSTVSASLQNASSIHNTPNIHGNNNLMTKSTGNQVFAITHCMGCKQQLQYAWGLRMIRCPSCNTIMNTPM